MQQNLFSTPQETIDLPDSDIRYYTHFIEQPDLFYQRLLDEVDWHQDTIQMYGKPVLIPRLNAWYGDINTDYSYSGLQLQPKVWTPCLLELKNRVQHFLQMPFNSVLANLYRNENDSVAWHSDDEPELGQNPIIASLSFGATRRFSLRRRVNNKEGKGDKDKSQNIFNMNLEAGSLLVMAGSTQQYWHHQVPKLKQVTEGRINLTFRQITPVDQRLKSCNANDVI